MGARRRARVAIRLGVALIWVALAVVLLEVYARVSFRVVDRANPLVAEYRRALAVFDGEEATLWDVPYRQYKKNAELVVEDGERVYHVTTNSLGFRGAEVALPKPGGLVRIVCVGGSTTVGGWTDETTYPAFLERELNERFAGRLQVEVVNAGISGIASDGELEKAPAYLALEPDLVVHYNVVNDLAWRIYPAIRRDAGWWNGMLRRSEFVRSRFPGWIEPAEEELVGRLRETTLANLAALGRATRAAGAGFAVASFAYPDAAKLDDQRADFLDHNALTYWGLRETTFAGYQRAVEVYNRELRKLAAEAGFVYLPVAETLTGVEAHYVDICHLDEQGMRHKARAFADALEPTLAARIAEP